MKIRYTGSFSELDIPEYPTVKRGEIIDLPRGLAMQLLESRPDEFKDENLAERKKRK